MQEQYTYLAIATPYLGLGFTRSGSEPTSGGSAEVGLPRHAPKRRIDASCFVNSIKWV
jgi:hypothetical protein